MKKEYIILTVLIVLLSAYLFFKKENADNYTLPAIEKVDAGAVTAVEIEKKNQPKIRLTRKDKTWTIAQDAFPADMNRVQTMLDTLKTFNLTALVSQKADTYRYLLDEQERIKVCYFIKDKEVFSFFVGKDVPTFNHTFVMLASDPNVYHAEGSFRRDFEHDVDGLRDKKILSISGKEVKQLSVSKDKLSKTVTATTSKTEGEAQERSWKVPGGKPVDKKTVDSFLALFSFLKCDTYPLDLSKAGLEKQTPVYTVQIEAKKPVVLKLYKAGETKKWQGTSSMNDYAFLLNDFDAKKITQAIDTFLGIKKKAP